jgi:hypothetical protein
MKKIFWMASTILFIVSCNSNPEPTGKTGKDSTTTTMVSTDKIDYAYLPANHAPDNWDRGDQHNVAIVLKSLKAFENGNVDGALDAFADSVHWSADGIDGKISKDDLKKEFTDSWAKMASLKIVMDDYESVVSKDKKSNWVSLWYKQISTDKTGKVDSVYCMDDAKIDNGKITVLDEKARKFPASKK